MAELTELIHRAYAPLAAAGMRYLGSYQDEATTRERCGLGESWVVERDGRVIAGVTWRHCPKPDEPPHYHRPDVAVFGQFVVEPEFQGRGIGGELLAKVESRAREAGFRELACDTAAPNEPLVAFYRRRGYRIVDRVRWKDANYESVILTKTLTTPPPAHI